MASSSSSPSSYFNLSQQQSIQTSLSEYINGIILQTNISILEPLIWGPTDTPNIATLPHEQQNPNNILDRITMTNNSVYTLLVIEGSSAVIDLLLHNLGVVTGEPPASKSSIEALPKVEGIIGDCVICLDKFGGEMGKEMPCKHVFHSGCLEGWLNIQGTCPICRYKLPIHSGEGRKVRRNFLLSVSLDDEFDERLD